MKRFNSLLSARTICLSTFGALTIGSIASPLVAQGDTQGNLPSDDEFEQQMANLEQAILAQDQLDANAASRAEFDRLSRKVEEEKERIAMEDAANQKAYADALAAHEAEVARLNAAHEARMAKWRADVAACESGKVEYCAPKPR